MNWRLSAQYAARQSNRPIGNNLVSIHVRLRATAGLPDAKWKVFIERTGDDFIRSFPYEIAFLFRQQSQTRIRECRR